MKFYTKEWYALMQRQHYTSGLRSIPDKAYSDGEIRTFYDGDLKAEIARDRRIYNTPPSYGLAEELLRPDSFKPEAFLFEDVETGELFHPETLEAAREYLERERGMREEQFASRPPFDPAETAGCFEECYKNTLRYGGANYPQWVRDSVDMRLLALQRIPESAYKRLKREERANRRAFDKIMAEAGAALDGQDIPERIKARFRFHDAHVLSIKGARPDVELCLRCGGRVGGTPYIKVIFKNVSKLDREKGFAVRPRAGQGEGLSSNCQYLYDELYRDGDGYEVHMLLWTPRALRYLTVFCEDIWFEDDMALS